MTLLRNFTAASVALMLATPASAMVVDLFEDDQAVSDLPALGFPQGSELGVIDVLGGYRDLFVESGTPDTPFDTSLVVMNGQLEFSNNTGEFGRGQIAYDGLDGDPTSFGDINTSGLTDGDGGIDLTFGISDPAFFFEILDADGNYEFSATVFEFGAVVGSGVGEATFTESVEFGEGATPPSPFLPLAFFSANGVDITNVGAVVFEIATDAENVSLDGAIGSISVVPLPASSLLLLGSVGGVFGAFAAVGRRRRRQA